MKTTAKEVTVTSIEQGVCIELTRKEAQILCNIMKRNIAVPGIMRLSQNEYECVQTFMGDLKNEICEALPNF